MTGPSASAGKERDIGIFNYTFLSTDLNGRAKSIKVFSHIPVTGTINTKKRKYNAVENCPTTVKGYSGC